MYDIDCHVEEEVGVPLAPTAQLVKRWAPGSHNPGSRRSGARCLALLAGMDRGRWQRPRPVEEVSGAGLSGYVGTFKFSTLNSVDDLKLATGVWQSRALLLALLSSGHRFPDTFI